MSLTLHDFFSTQKVLGPIDEREYEKAGIYINVAKAFAHSFYQPVFIADFYKKNFMFLSGNISHLCGNVEEQTGTSKDAFFFDHVPPEEQEMMVEIISKAIELQQTFPVEDRLDWTLSYYFHLVNDSKKRLIMHKVSPLRLSPDGQLWLAICSLSLSSRREIGHATMRRDAHKDYFQYSFKSHVWYYREGISLTDMERDVLILSSQGFTMKEIADRLFRSEDAIKACKRVLFAKLGVKSITEAVFCAINDNLLR